MTAERDSMTLNEIPYPSLGVEERSDEAPRDGRARATPDPEVVAKPKRRQFTAQYRLRTLEEADRCTQPGEVWPPASPRGVVQLSSGDLAQGAAQGLVAGVGLEEARRETGRTQPVGCEGARARSESGSPGTRVAHRAHDPGRAGKSCRAAGIEPRTRNALLMAAQPLAEQVGVVPACQALGVSRATFYRRQRLTPGHQQPRSTPARALCDSEREQVLDVLACPRFVDRAPAEVVATLLDEGHYLCSERTMYRILATNQPVRERRNQREHPQYANPNWWPRPRTRPGPGISPNCWGRRSGRTSTSTSCSTSSAATRSAGWSRPGELGAGRLSHRRDLPQTRRPAPDPHLALRPRGADDEQVHRTTARRPRGHARSLSRPQVSDDNPFSEAQFKTLKYHPGFPGRFHNITAAIAFCRTFFPWYNTEHRHGGIAMLTPGDVHQHRTQSVLHQRGRTLQAAWTRHPERLRSRHPKTRPPARSGLDQSTREIHNRRNCSVNRNRQCLKVVDRFRYVGARWRRPTTCPSRSGSQS